MAVIVGILIVLSFLYNMSNIWTRPGHILLKAFLSIASLFPPWCWVISVYYFATS